MIGPNWMPSSGFENRMDEGALSRHDFISEPPFSFGQGFENREAEGSLSHIDFILRLPQSIIHHILSFLPLKSIIVTSILSKSWYKIFISFNALVFDFIYDAYVRENPEFHAQENMLRAYLDLIDNKVCRRLKQAQDSGNKLHTFNVAINFPDTNLLTPRLNFWLSNAIEMNVSEVYIKVVDNDEYHPDIWYNVPGSLLGATRLTSLEISLCEMHCKSFTKLDYLRKLVLTEVIIKDDYMFQNLSVSCPLIEHLNLNACRGLKSFSPRSRLPRLRHLELSMCYVLTSIHVEAPSLQTLIFGGTKEHCDLTCEIFLKGASSSLKELKFHMVEIKLFSFERLLSQHPCIEHLMLKHCNFLCHFKMSSLNLRSLILRGCPGLSTLDMDTPNLELFDHDNPRTLAALKNLTSLHKVHIQLRFKNLVNWWSLLEELLEKTCFFKDLKLALKSKNTSNCYLEYYDPVEYYCDPQDVVIHNQINAVSFSQQNLKKLSKSNPTVLVSSLSYAYILDDLFDGCYPKTLSLVCSDNTMEETVIEDIMHYHRNWSKRSRKSQFRSEHQWDGCYRDFEVDASEGAEEEICTPLRSFLKRQSTLGFKTTTFELKWFKSRSSY